MQSTNYIKDVKIHYENYPYPYREPSEEKERLILTYANALERINHFCFAGKKDFNNFRALVAGCGTGDAVIFLAEQLRDKVNSEVVALDMTETSLELAKERAKIRGLENITWVNDSLLELANLNLGKFDFINCSGVLHHLTSPDDGLLALKSVLKDDGAMALMLYAEYGRTGVYQMQKLMRLVNENEDKMQNKVDNSKTILQSLPKTNWWKKNEDFIGDIKNYGDIGIYDLFLHSQDRAYTILEIYDFVEKADLNFIDFAKGQDRKNLLPESHIKDSSLLKELHKLSKRKQEAIAELIFGAHIKHNFYISKQKLQVPSINDLNLVPFLCGNFDESNFHQNLSKALKKNTSGAIEIQTGVNKVTISKKKYTAEIFKHLNSSNTWLEIFDQVRLDLKNPEIGNDDLINDFSDIYQMLLLNDLILLRAKNIPDFITWDKIQKRLKQS